MLKKMACSTNGQLILPTRNRWYESILLAGVTFALLRPYYVARVLLGAKEQVLLYSRCCNCSLRVDIFAAEIAYTPKTD